LTVFSNDGLRLRKADFSKHGIFSVIFADKVVGSASIVVKIDGWVFDGFGVADAGHSRDGFIQAVYGFGISAEILHSV